MFIEVIRKHASVPPRSDVAERELCYAKFALLLCESGVNEINGVHNRISCRLILCEQMLIPTSSQAN